MKKVDLRGVTVATVLPFDRDLKIDWDGYKRLLDYCAMPEGIAAVFVNGHAGEGATLTDEERGEVIERTRRHIGSKPLLSGIIANSTDEAIRQCELARQAGADCAVLFPPSSLGGGASASARAPVDFVRRIAEATHMPLSIFQYPVPSGFGFTTEALVEISGIEEVLAIKEGSDLMLSYEENWRAVKAANPDVLILPSNYNWFLPQLAVGGDGILSGLVSLVPHLFIELWDAACATDLSAMRSASDRLHPIVRRIYGEAPLVDMHTRIKGALKALAIIENADPRSPLMPLLPEVARKVGELAIAARDNGSIKLAR
ncbi:dihydrodipicolinate synthase family protein [Pseudochelatococcus sp. B33]